MSDTRIAYRSTTGQPTKEQRVQFVTARNQALIRQRDQSAARLHSLREEIAKIHHAVMTDTLSDGAKALTILERHRVGEQKLIEEITRLNSKIR